MLALDTVPERLRRWTRNPLGSARWGSNPLGVGFQYVETPANCIGVAQKCSSTSVPQTSVHNHIQHYLLETMLSVQTHLLHDTEMSENVSGLVAVLFVCNKDLWSWIVAILQESMRSAIRHLIHTFKFHCYVGAHGCWPPTYHVVRGP